MKTKPPSRTADQFVVRLPEGMRDRIAELAKENGRSMNTEIVQRLEWALSLTSKPKVVDSSHVQQPIGGALTWLITNEIKDLADKSAISFDEMFAKIVLAGLHPNAPQVVYLPILPGVAPGERLQATRAAAEVIRPDATVISENLWKAPWAPEWMIDLMRAKCPEVIAQIADQTIMSQTQPDAAVVQDEQLTLFQAKASAPPAAPEPPKRPKRIVRKKSEA